MRQHLLGGALLLLLPFASACSSNTQPDSAGGTSNSAAKSTVPSASTPAAPTTGNECPELVADVPGDLDVRRVHKSKDSGTPVSVGVIWSNPGSTRVVNVSSAPSGEAFGDGTTARPTERTVQGAVAQEIVVGDVHRVEWEHPGVPCPYWAVVSQGLTPQELNTVLESVSVGS